MSRLQYVAFLKWHKSFPAAFTGSFSLINQLHQKLKMTQSGSCKLTFLMNNVLVLWYGLILTSAFLLVLVKIVVVWVLMSFFFRNLAKYL